MGLQAGNAMVQKTVPFLAVLAVTLAAVGGVAAADGTAIQTDETNESTDDGPQMGVCVVGADSPCDDESTDGDRVDATHPTPLNGSDELGDGTDDNESRMWIPEDQNRDGEIDDRFGGDTLPALLFDILSLS